MININIGDTAKVDRPAAEIGARREMTRKLDDLGRERPNIFTMSGVHKLASELQARVDNSSNSMWPTDFVQRLGQEGTVFALRVGSTIIERSQISLSYEQGNLFGWLAKKGLDVTLDGSKKFDYPVDWSRLPTGFEEDYYFSKQVVSPPQLQVLTESVAAKLGILRDAAVSKYGIDSEQARLLDMATAVQFAAAEEIDRVVSGQGGLTAEDVRRMVEPQLRAVGFGLEDRNTKAKEKPSSDEKKQEEKQSEATKPGYVWKQIS